MSGDILELLGGIGLFLLGMHLMTDALRRIAGRQAREIMARFTRRPLSGAVTGTMATVAVQSSSATMITTVGFVGAGLLSFPQALGILYGAGIGTTVTGWLILLVGFKLQLTVAAFPVLFAAALIRVLAAERWARPAMMAAGLSLVFLGIGMMQSGLAPYEARLTPDSFAQATLAGRLQLVAIGVLVTLITQSSSAGVAGLLVLLAGQALTFEQAAALVIGMHIGTTFTPLLASVGGSVAVRQTALANVVYHVLSGVFGLVLIDATARLVVGPVLAGDAQLGLVVFHTGFNLAGAAVMLPLTGRFARLITRLVPEVATARASARLDRQLLEAPDAAIDMTAAVLRDLGDDLFAALSRGLRGDRELAELARSRDTLLTELERVEDFLSRVRIHERQPEQVLRFDALWHQLDHLRRLHFRAGQGARLRTAMNEARLARAVILFRVILERHAMRQADARRNCERLTRLEHRLARMEARMRGLTRRHPPHVVGLTSAELFRLTDALRWMRRSTHHVQRILSYQMQAIETRSDAAATPD